MKKEHRLISINANENWGGLENPWDHTAAFGARFADNRHREFGIFGNRMTLIGEDVLAKRLESLIMSSKVIKAIKKNTSFSYYGGDKPPYDDANNWSAKYSIGRDVDVTLDVTCRGEYVYVRAYADRAKTCTIGVEPIADAWVATMSGRDGKFPVIHANTRAEAMNMLVEFIANELESREDIWPV